MTRSKPFILGLTGNSGSGKNTAADILAEAGGAHIDMDALAHEVIRPGQPAYQEITALFGRAILSKPIVSEPISLKPILLEPILSEGKTASLSEIDRKKLGAIVFHDREKLKRLEEIVHRQVILRANAMTRAVQENPGKNRFDFIIWNAPLLAEAGMHKQCDWVWLISAPLKKKLARIQARDGISEEQARQRLQNQMAEEEIAARVRAALGGRFMIIQNGREPQLFEQNIRTALRELPLR
ncbi:MAG: dephospho-CoA kinase [Clostridiales bacterium]|jgi:dephospho-CoA kinase|nr:dephospho-CoA kinase [Clostridiales bacterium]